MRRRLARALERRPHLPVALLATMLVLGLGIEAALYGGAQWLTKLPLMVLLLLLPLLRVLGRGRR